MNERNDIVERALGYPYAVPTGPFIQLGHQTLNPVEIEIDLEDRTPVLAYGSNAAPKVLSRKLALSDQPVLVEPARTTKRSCSRASNAGLKTAWS